MNRPVHFEFHSPDLARDREFFGKVFDWKFSKHEGSPHEYWLANTGDAKSMGINGGLMASPDGQARTINSLLVDSVDKFAEKITANGGKIVVPKMSIPGVGYVAFANAPGGVCFGIFQADETAKG